MFYFFMGDVDLMKEAIALEAGRAKSYGKAASRVLNPTGKAALKRLAAAERRHLRILEKQCKVCSKKGDVDFENISKPVFARMEKKFRRSIKANRTDIDVMKSAVDIERTDASFYGRLIKKAKARGVKKLFTILQKEEKFHFKEIERALKNLRREGMEVTSVGDSRMMFFNIFNRK
jgi:rubrerythrin